MALAVFESATPFAFAVTFARAEYANRTGLVAALNVRDGEVGITFSSARSHDAAVWFEPDECVVEIGHTRHKAAQCHAKARPAVTDRELTAKRGAR